MRRKVGLGFVAVLVASWAVPASGAEVPTLSLTPTTGALGTEFFFSGDQCFSVDTNAPDAFGSWVVYTEGGEGLAAGGNSPDESGVWNGSIATSPPEASPLPGPGTYVIEAECEVNEVVQFSYEPVTFTVTDVPDSVPPPESSTTTAATAAPATAAANVAPSFTG